MRNVTTVELSGSGKRRRYHAGGGQTGASVAGRLRGIPEVSGGSVAEAEP